MRPRLTKEELGRRILALPIEQQYDAICLLEEMWPAAADALRDSMEVKAHVEYQQRPIDWIVEKLGVPRETLVWSMQPEYQPGGVCTCDECVLLRQEAAKRGEHLEPGPHVWDGDRDPFVLLAEAVARGDRKVGIESGNGTGKSFFLACLILWFLACWQGARVFTFAPKEDQLSLFIWAEIGKLWSKFTTWFPTAKLNHLELLVKGKSEDAKAWAAFGVAVGVREGEEVSAKASGMHAEHMMIVTEETQGMDARVLAANEATCTDEHNLRVALGNPGNPMDELHKFCTSPGATHLRISAPDHPNVVSGRRIVGGAVSRSRIAEAARQPGKGKGTRFYNTRIRGLCPEGGGPALDELTDGIHMVPAFVPPHHWTRFGALDWGHGHPWSFGKYVVDEGGRVFKVETLGGHRMRPDLIINAIFERFPDVLEWDYLVSGSDIKQRHEGRTPSHIVVKSLQEQFMECGLFFQLVEDGPGTRAPRLNNFRMYIGYKERGPVDQQTGRRKDGVPAFVFMDTPNNRECFVQCQTMTLDPKNPEVPKKRDANPETGEGGDDCFDETMNALSSRPWNAPRAQPKDEARRLMEEFRQAAAGAESNSLLPRGTGGRLVIEGDLEELRAVYG